MLDQKIAKVLYARHVGTPGQCLEIARDVLKAIREPEDADLACRYGTEPRRLFTEMIGTALWPELCERA